MYIDSFWYVQVHVIHTSLRRNASISLESKFLSPLVSIKKHVNMLKLHQYSHNYYMCM